MKGKIFLGVVTIGIFSFLFWDEIEDLIIGSPEIQGCTDPFANNRNPLATVDDGSCIYITVPPAVNNIISEVRNNPWDILKYKDAKYKIDIYYQSLNQSGSLDHTQSLKALDFAYIVVLADATEKAVSSCFSSSKNLYNEVDKFYSSYSKQSVPIKDAKSWFTASYKPSSFLKKVEALVSKAEDQASFNKLHDEITSFTKSSKYKRLKNCSSLKKDIAACFDLLNAFQGIGYRYTLFEKEIYVCYIPNKEKQKFKDFAYYDNLVKQRDAQLKLDTLNCN